LNRYPKLKHVLYNQLGGFENIAVDFVPGSTPTAIFYDVDGNEIESLTLGDMDFGSMSDLFKSKGFAIQRPSLPLPSGDPISTITIGGVFYELFKEKVYFPAASEFASSRLHSGDPGRLLTISCANQENALVTWLRKHDIKKVWLNAKDSENEGLWNWVSGPEAGNVIGGADSFAHWAPGEPNNANEEDCALLDAVINGWNDVQCEAESAAIVVEFGAKQPECTMEQYENYL